MIKNGLTVVLCIGKYAGFYFNYNLLKNPRYIRLCIGWAAFTIYFYDREVAVGELVQFLKQN